VDRDTVQGMGYKVATGDVISAEDFVRHDSRKLAKLIFNLIIGSKE